MIGILVRDRLGYLAARRSIPLVTEVDQVSRKMVLLFLRQFCQPGFNLLHTHGQTIAASLRDASGGTRLTQPASSRNGLPKSGLPGRCFNTQRYTSSTCFALALQVK